MANFAKPPVLALITLILTCTSILQVESTYSSNSSHPSPPASQVPEWFENCILHLVYTHDSKDVLVDREPFTSNDRVRRCWDDETQALAFPITPFCLDEVCPPYASPWLRQALRSLVDKGHVKPFSLFEVKSRVYRSFDIGRSPMRWTVQAKLQSFISDIYGKSVTEDFDMKKLPQPCQDYDCDLDSNEYWIQLFHVFRRRCWQHRNVNARRVYLPRTELPIPYRPPPLHL